MKHSTFTSIVVAFCFGALAIMASCNGSKTDTRDSTVSKDTLDQHLYNLWIETDTIKPQLDSTKRLLLNFFVGTRNAFTLQGWVPKDTAARTFSSPKIKFKIGKLSNSSLKVHQGTYLGNIVIRKRAVKSIITNTKNLKYLVLTPKDSSGHIIYMLRLTNGDPVIKDRQPTDEDLGVANPTPPRNYNGN